MKTIVQTANVEEETIPLKEVIPSWFAVSSPLIGVLMGLLGAWVMSWLSASRLAGSPDALINREEIIRSRFLPACGRH
jgi:hypothetical protein